MRRLLLARKLLKPSMKWEKCAYLASTALDRIPLRRKNLYDLNYKVLGDIFHELEDMNDFMNAASAHVFFLVAARKLFKYDYSRGKLLIYGKHNVIQMFFRIDRCDFVIPPHHHSNFIFLFSDDIRIIRFLHWNESSVYANRMQLENMLKVSRFRSLKIVRFWFCSHQLFDLMKTPFKTVLTVDIIDCMFDVRREVKLAELFPLLTKLRLIDNECSQLWSIIGHCPHLIDLVFWSPYNNEDGDYCYAILLTLTAINSQIRALSLQCKTLKWPIMPVLAYHLPKLERFFGRMPEKDPQYFTPIAYFKKLTHLSIFSCAAGDLGVRSSCLRYLDLVTLGEFEPIWFEDMKKTNPDMVLLTAKDKYTNKKYYAYDRAYEDEQNKQHWAEMRTYTENELGINFENMDPQTRVRLIIHLSTRNVKFGDLDALYPDWHHMVRAYDARYALWKPSSW